MKRKFVRVMLFGALTLAVSTAVSSCKDYDDDVKNLQEQIDKITSNNPVSTADMKAAITSAISTLQTQLQTAIDGKADNKAVQDLLATVTALQKALDGKADASTIKSLGDQITALSKEVNTVKGNLEAKQKELSDKVAALEEKLAGAASSEELKKLATELATAKNDLAAVKEMADNNAAAIVEIQSSIAALDGLAGKVAALEEFKATAATKDDLKGYVMSSELAGLVNDQVLDMLKDDGAIAQYVTEAIENQVLSETSAINQKIDGVNEDLAQLSADFDEYKKTQSTQYNALSGKVTILETFKTAIEKALADGGYNNFAEVLTQISTLTDNYASCITTSSLGGKVDAYLNECIGNADTEFGKLEMRIKALENQIQSVVYIPDYEDGKVEFMSYFYGDQLVAPTKPLEVKFRISPTTALENFAANYTPNFEGSELKTRGASIYTIDKVDVDKTTGIVTYTLSTTTDKSFAVSLNLTAVNQKENLTNINSNYFPVISDYRKITLVTVDSPQKTATNIYYDESKSTIDYITGAVLKINGTDRAGKAISNEIIKGADTKNFAVTYGLEEGDDNEFFKMVDGKLDLAEYSDKANGKKVTPNATVAITVDGSEVYSKVTKFAEVTAKKLADAPNVTVTLSAVEFNGAEVSKADVTIPFGTSGGTTDIGIAKTIYEALPQSAFTFKAVDGVTFAFKEEADYKNELELVVPAGTPAGTYDIEVAGQVSVIQSFKIKSTVTVKVTKAKYALTYDSQIITGSTKELRPIFAPVAKPESVNFSMDVISLFNNYSDIVVAAKEVGGSVKFSLKDAITGVSLNDGKLVVNNAYENKENKAIVINADVVAMGAKGEVKLADTKATTFTLVNISGSWTAPTSTTVKIGSDKVEDNINLATGATWTASNSSVIWKDGKESTFGGAKDVWGKSPLSIFGFTAPKFALAVTANSKFVTLTEDGHLTLTQEGKAMIAQLDVVVNITAESRWGTISNFDNGKTVTVKIDPTKLSTAITD